MMDELLHSCLMRCMVLRPILNGESLNTDHVVHIRGNQNGSDRKSVSGNRGVKVFNPLALLLQRHFNGGKRKTHLIRPLRTWNLRAQEVKTFLQGIPSL